MCSQFLNRWPVLLCLVLVLGGCRGAASPTQAKIAQEELENHGSQASDFEEPGLDEAQVVAEVVSGQWSEVDGDPGIDEAMDALIGPYREKMLAVMEEEIGVVESTLNRERPESPLGNFIADVILDFARNNIDLEADIALMNRGGIRLPEVLAGPITVADIYQLVPFDNIVVVLTLRGSQVESLLNSLADKQGEPLSGVVYQLAAPSPRSEGWSATNIEIGGKPLDPDATYKLATLDYLAGIGGEMAVLQEATQRQDGQPFLRDILVEAIRRLKTIKPLVDGRVTFAEKNSEE